MYSSHKPLHFQNCELGLTITEKEHKLITTIYTLKIAYGTTFIFNQHW